jgi:cell wall-associated NlpC family hydrolase
MNVRTPGSAWLSIGALALTAICAGACASTGYSPRPFPAPGGAAAPVAPHPAPADPASAPADPASSAAPRTRGSSPAPRISGGRIDGYELAGTALALRGIPYRSGGADPKGFDCSGFIQYVFSQYGLSLPRAVREQYQVGKKVKAEDLAPGDILFFATTDPGPSHVAIAVGGDQFVHAPSSTDVVRVEHLSSSYWSPRYLGARRILN